MPYNPGIQDVSGQIYAAGGAEAARISLLGTQAMANGISRGIDNAAGSIAGGIKDHQMTEREITQLGGKATAYHEQGALSTPDYEKFMSGNINMKRQIVSQADTSLMFGDHQVRTARMGAETAQTAEQTRAIKQGNDQNQILQDAQRLQSNGIIERNGRRYKRDANGAWQPVAMAAPMMAPGAPAAPAPVDSNWVNTLAYS